MNSNNGQILEDIKYNILENEPLTNLLEDDVQCGFVFYSEPTRVLKFLCTYCEQVSDNINFFCQHLSEHINEHEEQYMRNAYGLFSDAADDGDETGPQPSKAVVYEPSHNDSLLPSDLAGIDESKIVVEELDEAEEIAAEVEAEMRQELESDLLIPKEENSCSVDSYGYSQDDCEMKKTEIETNTEPHFSIVPKKKKRITTVKVIALKNRVAELYERIKCEEERRSRVCDTNPESATEIDPISGGIEKDLIGVEKETTADIEPVRQIIGETVITLLPQTESNFDVSKFTGVSTHVNKNECLDDKTTCPACGRKFRSAFSLTIHKRTHYLESDSNVKLAHKCSDCDQLFNKIPDLKEHIQEVHYPDGFICKICNRRLTSLTLLETHMRKIHLSRPFNCEICRKNFDTRDRFEEHVKAHISGQSYRCHICGRKYSTECILKQHMHRHKERIPQCCVVCGKMTLRITQHMKIHAPRPKKVLSCKACGKVFNFSSGLSHHYKVVHMLPKTSPTFKRERSIKLSTSNQQTKTEELKPNENTEIEVDMERGKNTEEINQKEEEAKRVIVELIQNATYTSFFPENFNHSMDCGPPIAREETISAVNSIVNEES